MDNEEDTPLHEAVRFSDLDAVRKALRDGYSPNKIGLYQWSPLHEASENGDTDILKLLLKYEGDSGLRDVLRGNTPAHYAAAEDQQDCLQLLIKAGAPLHSRNNDGQTPLQLATGDCLILLQNYDKQHSIHEDQHSIKVPENNNIPIISVSESQGNSVVNTQQDSVSELASDADNVSMTSRDSHGSSSYRSWSTEGNSAVVKLPSQQVLGHILLSFEYNSKSSCLKVRVWQVQDILMPPVETSMITALYVKGYLVPDKKKTTKRKTETLPVYPKSTSQNANTSQVFQPSTYVFKKALEYNKVTKEVVAERSVLLEVCITQKFSHRSYVIATWTMPLKQASRKLVKEKYPLTPRMSTELPENMKVYNGIGLNVSYTNRAYSSNPATRMGSMWSLPNDPNERSASDSNLQNVRIEESVPKSPSIEITVPSDEDDKDDQKVTEILSQVKITDKPQDSPSQIINIQPSTSSYGEYTKPPIEKELPKKSKRKDSNKSNKSVKEAKTQKVPSSKEKSSKRKSVGKRSSIEMHEYSGTSPYTGDECGISESQLMAAMYGSSSSSRASSRPDTPSWDNFEDVPCFTAIPIDAADEYAIQMENVGLQPVDDDWRDEVETMAPVHRTQATTLSVKADVHKPKQHVSLEMKDLSGDHVVNVNNNNNNNNNNTTDVSDC